MKNKKIRVAVLFGGKSAEHEVSVQSAKNIIAALNTNKYDVVPIKVEKSGIWDFDLRKADVVFPVLHGPYGEDGSMQGFFKLAGIPFVGSGVLGSAVAMDKDISKRLLQQAGLPVAKFLVFRKSEEAISFEKVKKQLGLPFFVKSANLGSSIGVTKVHSEAEFKQAVVDGFLYDTKIIIEEFIQGREIEVSVLGNEDPIVSLPGEIISKNEFYDYSAKYDEDGMKLVVPVEVADKIIKEIQELAKKVFHALCLEGMARIDFFLGSDNKLYINEANTIPGFTQMSVYPKLWEASGISNAELIDRLIMLALERHAILKKLKSSYLLTGR